MELTGEQQLALPKARVWEALNDPAILKRCLPGCDVFERDGDDRYKVGMVASVGPVKARFNGKLTLSDIQPPNSYALAFDGSGGAAGFGKGQAKVQLSDVEGGTKLAYSANAQVGGKLAQVGARLIDGVARKMADEFFTRFAKAVSQEAAPQEAVATAPTPAVAAPAMPPADRASSAASSSAAAAAPQTATAASARVAATYAAPAVTSPATGASYPQATPAGSVASSAAPAEQGMSRNIAVLAAAVSAIGAAVAVLAAAVALYAMH